MLPGQQQLYLACQGYLSSHYRGTDYIRSQKIPLEIQLCLFRILPGKFHVK